MTWLGAILLAAAGWAGTAQAAPPDAIQITLQRTACFGTCPAYSVTLRDDGTVTYLGREYTRVSGTHSWKIDPAAVRALAREMEQAGFFELEDEYVGLMTDHPTTYTSLTIGARTKKIRNYIVGPQTLKDLEDRIDQVAGVKKYVYVTGDAIREM